jgi:polyisoprenoid-binding protein YceI
MAWSIDTAHSQITFSVRHLMISNVRGRFESFTGVVNFNEQNPELSTVEVKIDASTINTREAARDGHLKSPDFFDAAKYPEITYVSTRVEKVDPNIARIYGDLTIKEITKEVVLDVEYSGQQSMWGKTAAGFSAKTKINRKDWGLNWNQALESGGILVGDDIRIEIELEIVKQPEGDRVLQAA